ncbi:HugZ family pyridoxamine 5'-phosphate oxidase [Roseomonas elaeocarpi]|uniref:HugZ family protein n=1 Tax=Roseomonas elaeocarpi TaxID=907779 RepID=A0ABV6JP42_9PROT
MRAASGDAAGAVDSADAGFAARALMRAASSATLATQRAGQPFASLVTPAITAEGEVLLFLSTLSEHTRQLQAEPRCALLFTGPAAEHNPQTAPRVSVTGVAEALEPGEARDALMRRWLARHPYAALYAGFGDFGLWRIAPGAALLVGGFARATRLGGAALRPDPAAVAAIAAAEAEILAHVNAEHADALRAIARGLLGGGEGAWRMVAADPDGCDLAPAGDAEGRVLRLGFPTPVVDAGGFRAALVAATKAGRAALAG